MGYPLIFKGDQPVVSMPVGAMDVPWTRPLEWPALPDPTGKQIFYGLFGVRDDVSHVAVLGTSSTGTFTVDWGDGTRDSAVASNTQVEKTYTYSSLAGYPEWNGYRMVTVTLSANTGNILAVSLQRKPNAGALSAIPTGTTINWLDVDMNLPNATGLNIGGTTVTLGVLEQFRLRQNSVTSTNFRNCYKLQSVLFDSTSSFNSFNGMFHSCYSLRNGPEMDTSNGTNFSQMFNACFSLESIPRYNTSKGTDFSTMFNGCNKLQAVPLFDTSKNTTCNQMFAGCVSLKSVPLFDTLSSTSFNLMFSNCRSLLTIPALDSRNVTIFNGMFVSCGNLITIPQLDTSKGTNFTGMFQDCTSIRSIPLIDTSNGTSFNFTFFQCFALSSIPDLNTSKGTNFDSFMRSCFSIVRAPTITLSAATNITNIFFNCPNLSEIPSLSCNSITAAPTTPFANCGSLSKSGIARLAYTHSYASCRLSRQALVDIFNNLPTVVGQTITITGNYGALSLTAGDRAIATGKGWTVTG